MAEVTGDIGGQSVQLNNAATETTLKQLLEAMKAMAAAKGAGLSTKAAKELEDRLKKLADQSKKDLDLGKRALTAEEKELKATEETIKKLKEQGSALQNSRDAVQKVATGMSDLGSGVFNLAKDISQLGDNIESVGNVLRDIPVFGGLVSTAFGAVASAANKTYDAFTQMAAVGANFGGSIQEMQRSVAETGLTMDQYTNIVKNNAQSMALLGGTTSEGAKRFARLSKDIRTSGIGDELLRMGLTTEEINSGLASFTGTLAKTGALRGMSDTQIAAATGTYLKNLDAVSKLTGQSREELQKQRDERMRDAQMRIMMSKMDAESQANLHALMDSIPKEHQAGLKEIMATGTATSEEGVKALAFLKGMGVDAQGFGQQIRATGKLTKDQMVKFGEDYQKGATQFAKSGLADTLGKFGDEGQKAFVVAAMDVAARSKTFGQAMDESAEAAKKQKEEGLQAEELAKQKQALTDLTNQFTAILANSALLPALLNAFQAGMETVGPILISTIEFIGNNGTLVASVLGAVAGALLIFKTAVALNTIALQAQALKASPLASVFGGLSSIVKNLFGVLGPGIKIFTRLLGPIGILVTVGTLLYKGFQYLYDAGWDFQSVLEALGDNLKGFFITLSEGFLWVLDKVTFGDANKKIKAAQRHLQLQREELEEKEKARDERRRQVAEQRAQDKAAAEAQENATQATNETTEAKKEEVEAIEDKINVTAFGDPNALIKQFSAQQTRPTMSAGPVAAMPVGEAQKGLQAQLAAQGITDPKAVANIMAQVQAESGFKPQSENLNYSGKKLFELYGAGNKGGNKVRFKSLAEAEALASKGPEAVGNMIYGGRMGNQGDEGFKYRGRGLIQLTGKANYAKFGKMIGVDLVSNPDLANDPAIAQKLAAAYFAEKQKGGTDLTDINAVGKAVGYAGGAAETAKRAQLAQGFASQLGGGSAVAPAGGAAATAMTAAATPTTGSPASVAAAAQDSPTSLLQSLNSKMDQLIAINRRLESVGNKQVAAVASQSDLYIGA